MDEKTSDSTVELRDAARRTRAEVRFDAAPRGLAGQRLATVLDDDDDAQQRYRLRRPVFGLHGEDYDDRRERVQAHVSAFNDRAISLARQQAIDAGWTDAELRASGLERTE